MLDRRWWALGAGSLCVVAYLSVAEAQGPGGRGGRFTSPLMQALDADGDGELSAKEIENATAAPQDPGQGQERQAHPPGTGSGLWPARWPWARRWQRCSRRLPLS